MNKLIRISKGRYIVTSNERIKKGDIFYLKYKNNETQDFYVSAGASNTPITTTTGEEFDSWCCSKVEFSNFPIETLDLDFGDGLEAAVLQFNKIRPIIVINHLDDGVTLNGDRKYTLKDLETICSQARNLKLEDGAKFDAKKFAKNYIDKIHTPNSEWDVEILGEHVRIIK